VLPAEPPAAGDVHPKDAPHLVRRAVASAFPFWTT
jgi:hypothetical protein